MPGAPNPYFRIVSERFAGHGRKFAKKASEAKVVGGLCSFEAGVGTIRTMQAADKILGIFTQAMPTTDADYANTSPINVEIIFRGAEIFCPVSVGTVALTELGSQADVVNGGLSITLTESNNDFREVALNGTATNSVFCTAQTVIY